MRAQITYHGLILACLAASSCTVLQPRPDPSRFFVLAALAGPEKPTTAVTAGISISLDPIHFPSYLNRPQLATRLGPNELRFSEHRRWAEPLEDDFTRVLTANLAALLGAKRVTTDLRNQPAARIYRVAIDVLRFEVTAKRRAELTARWAVGEDSAVKQSTFSAEAQSASTTDAVAALSECLGHLSRAIAAAVEERERKRPQNPSVP